MEKSHSLLSAQRLRSLRSSAIAGRLQNGVGEETTDIRSEILAYRNAGLVDHRLNKKVAMQELFDVGVKL
jgi:hypothetical protein